MDDALVACPGNMAIAVVVVDSMAGESAVDAGCIPAQDRDCDVEDCIASHAVLFLDAQPWEVGCHHSSLIRWAMAALF